jgi:hypothetical protein
LSEFGGTLLKKTQDRLLSELEGFENYDPWNQDYRGRSGYCVLCLRLALWALYWSFQKTHPKLPDWLPEWIFEVNKKM